ncbi:uncharacterized protein J3R85_005590 [Psidium guajava]|nr:uncharacterized protein J3R85_005590 [Psidium guajava]
MRPVQPPPGGASSNPANHRSRRRSDLTLPLPHRNTNLAVPLPLPLPLPPPSSSAPSTSAGRPRQLDFSELDRLSRIGSGNGGTVYKVVHRPTGRLYSPQGHPRGPPREDVLRQIRREVQILRDVDDANVVRCHDMSDRHGTHRRRDPPPPGVHGRRLPPRGPHRGRAPPLPHRPPNPQGPPLPPRPQDLASDIKPSNLLINSKNQVKIADFGVSRCSPRPWTAIPRWAPSRT